MIALVSGAAYWASNRDNLSEYSFPEFGNKDILNSAFQRAKESDFTRSILSRANLMMGEGDVLLEKAANQAESAITNIVNDFKFETFQKIRDTVNERVDTLSRGVGIEVNGNEINEISPLAFSVKSGILAYFTLINRENKALSYQVDWQDGNKDEGALEIGGRKVLSHKWTKTGDYLIQFKIITETGEKKYQFSISIF